MKSVLTIFMLLSPMILWADDRSQKATQTTDFKTDGFEKAQSIDDVKKGLVLTREWKEFEWKENRLLIGLSEMGDGESYIDVHGYIYDRYNKEWRRFCFVRTRNVYGAEVGLDTEEEELYLLAKGNTPMKGKRVFRYSLLLLSDNRGYSPRKAEQDGTGQPATRSEFKSEGSDKPQPEAEGRSR